MTMERPGDAVIEQSAGLANVAASREELQNCLRDLVSLLALPAMWQGRDVKAIAEILLDVLTAMLRPELVFVELKSASGESLVQAGHKIADGRVVRDDREVADSIGRGEVGEKARVISNSSGGADLRVLQMGLGADGRGGILAVGSSRTDFPTALEQLLVRVAANQVAIGLQGSLLTAELKCAVQKAESAGRAKDEFLAMLGHELRNPLSPILTALQLMQLRLGDIAARERHIIERQVQHLVRLIDDLLDVSRITQRKIELARRPVEMSEIIANAIEMTSPLLEQRRHHLELSVPQNGLCVHGDAHRLAQVVCNLLTNAAKYTEPGGKVEVIATREKDGAVLRVRDTGIGIRPDLLTKLFGLFVQGDASIDRSQGGLGLGLAIVHSLVSMHDGSVSAYSAGLGRGSEFVVRLPLAEAVSGVGHPAPQHAPARRADARRILIVDDNRDAAEVLAEALIASGHVARFAFDGPSAIKVAPEFAPDVCLLDIGLPVLDGYELARRLRELPSMQSSKLIAVTGYGQPGDFARSHAAGFDAHLVKPVDVTHIEQAMARLFHELMPSLPVDID